MDVDGDARPSVTCVDVTSCVTCDVSSCAPYVADVDVAVSYMTSSL